MRQTYKYVWPTAVYYDIFSILQIVHIYKPHCVTATMVRFITKDSLYLTLDFVR